MQRFRARDTFPLLRSSNRNLLLRLLLLLFPPPPLLLLRDLRLARRGVVRRGAVRRRRRRRRRALAETRRSRSAPRGGGRRFRDSPARLGDDPDARGRHRADAAQPPPRLELPRLLRLPSPRRRRRRRCGLQLQRVRLDRQVGGGGGGAGGPRRASRLLEPGVEVHRPLPVDLPARSLLRRGGGPSPVHSRDFPHLPRPPSRCVLRDIPLLPLSPRLFARLSRVVFSVLSVISGRL